MDLELGQRFKLTHSAKAIRHERTHSIKAQQRFGFNFSIISKSVCVCANITMYSLGQNAKHRTRDAYYTYYIP